MGRVNGGLNLTRSFGDFDIALMLSLISDCCDVLMAGNAFWLSRKAVQPFKFGTIS